MRREQLKNRCWITAGATAWLGLELWALPRLNHLIQGPFVIGVPALIALIINRLSPCRRWSEARRFTRGWTIWVGGYSVGVAVVTLFLLVALSCIGYLPYSDRPGPGWNNIPMHFPIWEETSYFAGWAAGFLFPACVWWGGVIFVSLVCLSWFGVPEWLIRTLGALACGIMALIVTAAAGWYIAIAAFPVYGAAATGLLFGALVRRSWGKPNASLQSGNCAHSIEYSKS